MTSPGGSTAEGIRALEKGGLRYSTVELSTVDKNRVEKGALA